MRFLKRKVILKRQDGDQDESEFYQENTPKTEMTIVKQEDIKIEPKIEESSSSFQSSKNDGPSPKYSKRKEFPNVSHADSKNIIKNYGKALCSFASSSMAVPYINKLVSKNQYEGFDVKNFMKHMKQKKSTTNSMESLRKLLIVEDGDSKKEKIYKIIFKDLSIIFLKFFVVNWIYSGRLIHKHVHLKFRFKILRRIRNPECFTYLKAMCMHHLLFLLFYSMFL